MNIKIFMHLMPWELDDAFQAFNKISLSNKYIDSTDKIYIETCLNLSSYIIDWNKSKLPKEFFIDKYNYICKALQGVVHKSNIYEKNELYGHLDFQREIVESHIDYYMSICPDIYFHHHTIFLMIESAKNIKDDYFIITPEISKLWDESWEILTNKNFKHINYSDWDKQDINDIIHFTNNCTEEPYINKINVFKYAGWFDLYNKNFYERLVPCFDNWHGYGPWDSFGTNVSYIVRDRFKLNINQYVLRNQVIFDKGIGIFENKKNPNVYKKYLYFNDIPNQRKTFENNMNDYSNQWFEYAKNNKII